MKTNITKKIIVAVAFFLTSGIINAQVTHDVVASGMSFTPANLTINIGDTVRWTNSSGTHNVNGTTATFSGNPESFGNSLGAGWVFDHKFTIAGNYDYRCDQHFAGGMVGTIVVVDPTASIETITTKPSGIVNIYPIPASNELTVELSDDLFNEYKELGLIIFDLNGKEVLSKYKISNAEIKLNTSELENGTYIISLMVGSTKLKSQNIYINK